MCIFYVFRHCHRYYHRCCILTLGYCARIPFAAQASLLYPLQMLYLRGCWRMRRQCGAVCTARCRGVGCMWWMMVMGGRARTVIANLLWQRLSSAPQCWTQIVRDFRLWEQLFEDLHERTKFWGLNKCLEKKLLSVEFGIICILNFKFAPVWCFHFSLQTLQQNHSPSLEWPPILWWHIQPKWWRS